MSLNLYFKTDLFKSNEQMASYIYTALLKEGLHLEEPQNDDYMYSIQSSIDGETVFFYMGKNDEVSMPALWQLWPEQKVSVLRRLFGKPNNVPEDKAKSIAERIVRQIEGVSGVEWGI